MAQKSKDNPEFDLLKSAVGSDGQPDNLYFFYGAERYMLDHYLGKLRDKLVFGDFIDFNYHKFTGSSYALDEVAAACEALPVFGTRTMIEVHDLDILKASAENRERISALTADLPFETCLVIVSLAEEVEKENLTKLKKIIGKNAHFVSFDVQDGSKLVKWIQRHFSEFGKTVDASTAEYLSFVTGGQMTNLKEEIDKLSFYVNGNTVTRSDIDKLVIPDVEAQSYTMTDHLVAGRFGNAAAVLTDLLNMQEAPHKLMFSISSKLRQLLLAKLILENSQDVKQLMKVGNINFEFQARNLMAAARSIPLDVCRQYVLLCAESAFRMNTGVDPQIVLTEFFIQLANTAGRYVHA